MPLKTDYKNDILNDSMIGRRRYRITNNDDGSVSFVDISEYDQVGDLLDAEDVNKANELLNRLDGHKHTIADITDMPTKVSHFENDVHYIKASEVENSLNDTSELPVQNKVIKAKLDTKVDKISGKELSANDFTDELKNKLEGIEANANKTIVDSAMSTSSTNPVQNKIIKTALDTKVDKVNGKQLSTEDFTTTLKNKLEAIESGANKITVDTAMSTTSTNPVQNKIVKAAIDAVSTKVDNIIDDAPEAYDTLKEISEYISTHETEYEALLAISNNKVDKEAGKGLSTNDFTDELLDKLNGIEGGSTNITVDDELSSTSRNPVQNKIINAALEEINTNLSEINTNFGEINTSLEDKISISNVVNSISSSEGNKIPTSQAVIDYLETNGAMSSNVVVPVIASGFTHNSNTNRYEQTITVDGMNDVMGGSWDILRSGEVLSEEESKIAASITDVIRQTNAIKIVCTEIPLQNFSLILYGIFKGASDSDTVLSNMGNWFSTVSTLEENMGALMANNKITEQQVVSALPEDASSHPTVIYWVTES